MKWWTEHYRDVKDTFQGQSYSIKDADNKTINLGPAYDVLQIDSCFGEGLNPQKIHYGHNGGGNSGFQAVNLAYLLGADTVLLLGFDMFGTHFFGPHPPKLRVNSPFEQFKKTFETIDQTKIQVINCTRKTDLHCFPKMSLESALSSVLAPA